VPVGTSTLATIIASTAALLLFLLCCCALLCCCCLQGRTWGGIGARKEEVGRIDYSEGAPPASVFASGAAAEALGASLMDEEEGDWDSEEEEEEAAAAAAEAAAAAAKGKVGVGQQVLGGSAACGTGLPSLRAATTKSAKFMGRSCSKVVR
jgi:hypothetical protein